MSKIYRSAQGRVVDMEKLRLANEETIAVGNMKVNARGDQLGPGGKIVKTRNQLMKEYYQLNTPVSVPSKPERSVSPEPQAAPQPMQVAETLTPLDREMLDLDDTDSDLDDKPKAKQKK